MPLYEYQCPKCGNFEKIHKFSDAPLTKCPTCGSDVQKLFSAPAIQFKGTGWYITDYARKSDGKGKGESGKDSGGDSGKGEGSKSEGSSKEGSKSESSKSESSKSDGAKSESSKSEGSKGSGGSGESKTATSSGGGKDSGKS